MSFTAFAVRIAAVGLLLSGCADVADAPRAGTPGSTTPSEPVGSVAPETAGDVLAVLQLSPTHRLEFAQYPDLPAVNIREWLHADRDLPEDSMQARVSTDATMAETYIAMAGEQVDWKVAALLDAAEEALNNGQRFDGRPTESESDGVAEPQALEEMNTREAGENVGTLRQAACSEPASPLSTDAAWFARKFCPSGNEYCKTGLGSNTHTGAGRTKHSDSSHFNQNSCLSRSFSIQAYYNCIWDLFGCIHCTKTVSTGEVPVRTVLTQRWFWTDTDVCGDWPTWTAANSGYKVAGMMHDVH